MERIYHKDGKIKGYEKEIKRLEEENELLNTLNDSSCNEMHKQADEIARLRFLLDKNGIKY